MTEIQPDIRASLPAAMVEAAAKALRNYDRAIGQRSYADAARAVLAAALAECEVTEEFGHTRKVWGAPWHTHRCPTSTHHRLVIVTPAEDVVVTPAQEGTAT